MILNEFYRVTFRKKVYGDLETLQTDLDEYMNRFNTERTHRQALHGVHTHGDIPRRIGAEQGKEPG
jgi:hypothetical protein